MCWSDCSVKFAIFLQDARDDVGGAQNTGMLGILVRTGKNLTPLDRLCFHVLLCLESDVISYTLNKLSIMTTDGFSTFLLVISQVNTEKEMRKKSALLLTSHATVSQKLWNTSWRTCYKTHDTTELYSLTKENTPVQASEVHKKDT